MARRTAIENEDGLWKGFYKASEEEQKKRTKAWQKAQKAIDKLAKRRG
jgi:hypothetical protein